MEEDGVGVFILVKRRTKLKRKKLRKS